jgi:hypothetical protein
MDVLPNAIYARETFLPMSLPRPDLQRNKCHSGVGSKQVTVTPKCLQLTSSFARTTETNARISWPGINYEQENRGRVMAKSDIDHKILKGKFKNRFLNSLSVSELAAYIKELQANPDNPYLLEVAKTRFSFLKFPPKETSAATLGAQAHSTVERIVDRHFRSLVKKYHPDKQLNDKELYTKFTADLNKFRDEVLKDVSDHLS